MPESIGPFRVVRQRLPALPVPGCPEAERCLYLKRHKDDPRAIFIANCVPGLTEGLVVDQLADQFPGLSGVQFGTVAAGNASFALVQLQSDDAVQSVLKNDNLDLDVLVKDPVPDKLGLPGILKAYKEARPGESQLRQWAQDTMREFEERETERKEEIQNRGNVVDDDGFVLVQRGVGKRARNAVADASGTTMLVGSSASEAAQHVASHENRRKKKFRGSDFLDNFYRFQQRDAKQAKVASLRSHFAEDKKRVAQATVSRDLT